MKIKFVCYWANDKDIYSFVNDIWNLNGEFTNFLTYEEDYTHLVIFNSWDNKSLVPKEQMFGIILEPFWSPSFDHQLVNKCKYIFHPQPEKFETNNVIFTPLLGTHRLYNCPYHGELIFEEGTTKKILETEYSKTKELSIIVNRHPNPSKHKEKYPESLYFERERLINKLLNTDYEFDMYGQDWETHDVRYKGHILNKLDGIKDYQYTICLENSSIEGYITEKYLDAILCNTIPIYNGHPSIAKYYPNSYEYLEYNGFEIDRIREIMNNEKTYKNYDLEGAKNLYLNQYNTIKLVLEHI